MSKRIVILHDYFLYRGGGERLVIALAKALKCPVVTAFIAKDAFDPRAEGIETIELYKESRFSNIPGFRYLQVNLSFFFKTKSILKNFDIAIYSGDSLTALFNAKNLRNIAYMHTPPRHLFDSYDERMKSYGILKKLIFIPYAVLSKWRFRKLSKKFDLIITNSKTVQDRIKLYLGLNSEIVYPPCDAANFHWILQGDYFFSWARLYPAKRVDMIVQAFTKMPDKKLVVASSGPEIEKIKKIAKGHENIKILDWIDDEELIEYLGKSLATIYIPVREDFGMSPVESMKAGKPVIGVAEGGLLETIIDGKTGILIKSNFTEEDIISAVREMTAEKALSMRKDCEKQAEKFSTKRFVEGVRKFLV